MGEGVVKGVRDWISTQDMVPVLSCAVGLRPGPVPAFTNAKASKGAVAGWTDLIAISHLGI